MRRPCLLRRMGYSGFFRCFAVRAALAPPETRPGGASLRSAAPGRVPSQALSNAPVGSVHCPAASAPLAQLRVRGAFGQKNPPSTAEQ
ncbi:MAG: hypothetical protein WBZ29_16595, partial [Methanocella sp.]